MPKANSHNSDTIATFYINIANLFSNWELVQTANQIAKNGIH